jgi:predicted transcriptional regulator
MSDQSATSPPPDLLDLTAQIVTAHVRGTPVSAEALPELIRSVHKALSDAGATTSPAARAEPAVPISHSVFPDYIVCLEDGRKLKMLKRHLRNAFGMTPDQYREKWDLPGNYPMVAPNYAKRRSALAKQRGLGRKAAAASAAAAGPRHATRRSAKVARPSRARARRGRYSAKP